MEDSKLISQEIVEIFKKIREGRIYGSVEIYFEEGEATQITQRIIKKVGTKKKIESPRQNPKAPKNVAFAKKTHRRETDTDSVDLPANSY